MQNRLKNKKISVVIPVYNEEENIEKLFERLVPVMDNLGKDYEIILVDDGSVDLSLKILLKHTDKRIHVIELTRNYGQHAAIFAGFESCTGDIIITMDADLQNPPEEVPRLVERIRGGHDVVGTRRKKRKD